MPRPTRCLDLAMLGLAAALVPGGGLAGQRLAADEAVAIVAEAVRFHLEDRPDPDGFVLGPISVDSAIVLDAPEGFDLTTAVARVTGGEVRRVRPPRRCDTSFWQPFWTIEDGRSRLRVTLGAVAGNSAAVWIYRETGRILSDGTTRRYAVRRVEGRWRAVGQEGGNLHGTPVPCRPAPPPELSREELAELLRRAASSVARPPLCVQDMLSGWVGDLAREAGPHVLGEGFFLHACRSRPGSPAPPPEALAADRVMLLHIAFHGPDQAVVQAVAADRPVPCADGSPSCISECTWEREGRSWWQVFCRPVTASPRFPGRRR